MHKILFLDFDGVLHPSFAKQDQLFMHMPKFADAMIGSKCEVVISSSWRHHHEFEYLRQLFPITLRHRITYCTGAPEIWEYPRYQEILAHLALRDNEVDWRALDDSKYEFPDDCEQLILCNPSEGLGARQLETMKEWLLL